MNILAIGALLNDIEINCGGTLAKFDSRGHKVFTATATNVTVFTLDYPLMPDQTYPDGNVSYETFCSRYMLEMETLSPLRTILPGGTVEHPETWTLIK